MTFYHPSDDRDIIYRMIGMMLMACSVLVILAVVVFCLTGCRQWPATKGEVYDMRKEQTKIDAKQSESISSAFSIAYGMNGVLFQAASEEVKPAVKQLDKQITKEATKAEITLAKTRERADLAEKESANVDAAPNAGQWLSGIMGAFGGNFSGIIELLMGALGVGGLAQAARMKSRAERMAGKADMYAGMDPVEARKLAEMDEDLAKHRKKKK